MTRLESKQTYTTPKEWMKVNTSGYVVPCDESDPNRIGLHAGEDSETCLVRVLIMGDCHEPYFVVCAMPGYTGSPCSDGRMYRVTTDKDEWPAATST